MVTLPSHTPMERASCRIPPPSSCPSKMDRLAGSGPRLGLGRVLGAAWLRASGHRSWERGPRASAPKPLPPRFAPAPLPWFLLGPGKGLCPEGTTSPPSHQAAGDQRGGAWHGPPAPAPFLALFFFQLPCGSGCAASARLRLNVSAALAGFVRGASTSICLDVDITAISPSRVTGMPNAYRSIFGTPDMLLGTERFGPSEPNPSLPFHRPARKGGPPQLWRRGEGQDAPESERSRGGSGRPREPPPYGSEAAASATRATNGPFMIRIALRRGRPLPRLSATPAARMEYNSTLNCLL